MTLKKLILLRKDNQIYQLLYDGNRLLQVRIWKTGTEDSLNSIYIGKVKHITPSIDGAFVEFRSGVSGFLSLKTLQSPIMTNRAFDGRVLAGDEIAVQVTKEKIGKKPPGLTANLSFAGKYCVLTRGNRKIGYSSKLTEEQKKELKRFLEEEGLASGLKEANMGLIFRTNVGFLSDRKALKEEILSYLGTARELEREAPYRTCLSCLYRPLPDYLTGIRDMYEDSFDAVTTDDEEIYKALMEHGNMIRKPVTFYEDHQISLEKLYAVESRLQEALQEKVWLASGGYLVIQPTEALTVIDVNSGRQQKRKKQEEAIPCINREAAEEIARQIRLRNLSGIIVVDFINQDSSEEDKRLLAHLSRLLKEDSVQTNVVDMTPLGLVEITRKKISKTLREQLLEK